MAICDTDEQYVKKLAEYLASQDDFPMEVTAFTDTEALSAYAKEAEPDFLLIADGIGPETIDMPETVRIIRISDEKDPAGGKDSVWRFQSRDGMKADLLAACCLPGDSGAEEIPEPVIEGEAVIRGVFSPVGRSGKTLFAITLGEILAEKGRTLYINLEDCHALSAFGAAEERTDLSDLIYQYRIDPEKAKAKFQGSVQRFERLEYVPPAFSPEDLRDIGEEEWIGLLNLIAGTGIYKEIVLDLGSRAGSIPRLLKLCRRIYVPTLEDTFSQAKLAHFRQLVKSPSLHSLEEKISFLKVPLLPDEGAGTLRTSQLVRGRIGSYIRHAMKNGQISEEREW